jgi:hypothetical protein
LSEPNRITVTVAGEPGKDPYVRRSIDFSDGDVRELGILAGSLYEAVHALILETAQAMAELSEAKAKAFKQGVERGMGGKQVQEWGHVRIEEVRKD